MNLQIANNMHIFYFFVVGCTKDVFKILNYIQPYNPKKSIAITGTNGKTSTAWYLSQICK